MCERTNMADAGINLAQRVMEDSSVLYGIKSLGSALIKAINQVASIIRVARDAAS
jgi:hypothetical protein